MCLNSDTKVVPAELLSVNLSSVGACEQNEINLSELGSGSGLRVGHPLRMRAAAPTQAGQVLFRLENTAAKWR
jgi:hypothetical protein